MDTSNDNPNMGIPKMETPNIMETPKKGPSLGPVIGLVVILAIIIMGSLYFWAQKSKKIAPLTTPTESNIQTATETNANDTETSTGNNIDTVAPDAQTQTLKTQSSSSNTTSIESDLNATDFQNIDFGADNLQ